MKKKHKKQLRKLVVSLIIMLLVTVIGYFKSDIIDKNKEMLMKTVRKNSNII